MARSARLTETSAWDEQDGELVAVAGPGGTVGLEDPNWQQGLVAIVTESQSIIIVLQQGWQGAGARQASAGAAAHRATTTNISIAPFLPMFRVYAQSLGSA